MLIRESFLTGALGVACFVSLLLPRPLMFYIGRQFMAGDDPGKRAQFDAEFLRPGGRRVHCLITAVWGGAYGRGFVVRVVLVLTLPPVVVVGLAPIILGAITFATIGWTMAYVRSIRRRAASRIRTDGR